MPHFLQQLHFDRISFWLGFLAASLFWWLLGQLRPLLNETVQAGRARWQTSKAARSQAIEARLANAALEKAQRMHLAAGLFPLDQVLIAPRLLAPPALFTGAPEPGDAAGNAEQILPYLPDWPELGGALHAGALSPAQALQGGAHLALIGPPGSGKSVALAALACQLARREPQLGKLAGRLPLLAHAAALELPPPALDLPHPAAPGGEPRPSAKNGKKQAALATGAALAPLAGTLAPGLRNVPRRRLSQALQAACRSGQAVLLLDGLDELSPAGLEAVLAWLKRVQQAYPQLQMVVSAAEQPTPGLGALGFAPLAVAGWDTAGRRAFLAQWRAAWCAVAPAVPGQPDPYLAEGWLLPTAAAYTPLELTLAAWSAFGGDALGSTSLDAGEAHLRRLARGDPALAQALRQIAAQAALTLQPVFSRADALRWAALPGEPGAHPTGEPAAPTAGSGAPERMLSSLVANGALQPRPGDRLQIAHPVLAGLLAAGCPAPTIGETLASQPAWLGQRLALQGLAAAEPGAPWLQGWVGERLSAAPDELSADLFTAARLLGGAGLLHSSGGPGGAFPQAAVMLRRLSALLKDEQSPFGLRARALAGLVQCGASGVQSLLRQELNAAQPRRRQLAALGLGALANINGSAAGDEQCLAAALDDRDALVQQAAGLALAALGSPAALEALGGVLLSGSPAQRQAAAVALAGAGEDGHAVLTEAAAHTDLHVRRAAVAGLARLPEEQARQELTALLTDAQWLVQSAAAEALENLAGLDRRAPQPLPPLHQAPWLIAFAGRQGLGVIEGEPAARLARQALLSGSPDEQAAAIQHFSRYGLPGAQNGLAQLVLSGSEEIRESALTGLWQLAWGN